MPVRGGADAVCGQPGPASWPAPLFERRIGPAVVWMASPAHPTAQLEVLAAVAGLTGLLALAFLPLDFLSRFVGQCQFHAWTGIPCLTCGATRAIVAMGAGRFLEALRANPLLTAGVALTILYTPAAWLLWLGKLPRPRLRIPSAGARWAVAGLAVGLLVAQWLFLILDHR